MNALPVKPYGLASDEAFEQYFSQMNRLNFDIGCIQCKCIAYNDVAGSLRSTYIRFSRECRHRGYPACVYLDISIADTSIIDIAEAQFYDDNTPACYGDGQFYVSNASRLWRSHLKDLVGLFIQDLGYNWVLFGETANPVDIPGTQDRFHQMFLETYPDVDYPEVRSECPEYLKLQKLKADIVIDLYRELTEYARAVGAEKIGVVPRTFIPTVKNTPSETLNTCCDHGRLICLPSVDFAVSTLCPDMIRQELIDPGDDSGRMSLIAHAEVLAKSVGKPVIVTVDPACVQSADGGRSVESRNGYRSAVLSVVAAAPNGVMIPWSQVDGTLNEQNVSLTSLATHVLSRFSHQRTPVAFIYSDSARRHAEPFTLDRAWSYYWNIARVTLMQNKRPALTFTAEALMDELELNPQVQVLILEEHSPLTKEDVALVLKWWQQESGRVLLVVGSGMGFSAAPDVPGERPLTESFPGLLERIGLRLEDEPSVRRDSPIQLLPQSPRKGILGDGELVVQAAATANIRRVFGAGANVLYADSDGRPIITSWGNGISTAFFVGLGSYPTTAKVITRMIRHALMASGSLLPPVICSSQEVLWNSTTDNYVIVANCSKGSATATIVRKPYAYWDVLQRRLVRDSSVELNLEPGELRMLRWLAKTAKLYDVTDALHLRSISAGAGRAEIGVVTRPETGFIVRSVPRKMVVDGEPVGFAVAESHQDYSKVVLDGVQPGEHVVTMFW